AVIELGADVDDGLDLRVNRRHVERRAAEERVLYHLGQRRNLRLQNLGHECLDHGLPDAVANRFAQALAEAGDVGLLERCRDAGREIISGNTESLDEVRYCALDLRLQFADLPLRGFDLRPNGLLGHGVTYAAAQEQADTGAQRTAEEEAQQPADDGTPSRGGRNLPLHAVQVLQQSLSLGDVAFEVGVPPERLCDTENIPAGVGEVGQPALQLGLSCPEQVHHEVNDIGDGILNDFANIEPQPPARLPAQTTHQCR